MTSQSRMQGPRSELLAALLTQPDLNKSGLLKPIIVPGPAHPGSADNDEDSDLSVGVAAKNLGIDALNQYREVTYTHVNPPERREIITGVPANLPGQLVYTILLCAEGEEGAKFMVHFLCNLLATQHLTPHLAVSLMLSLWCAMLGAQGFEDTFGKAVTKSGLQVRCVLLGDWLNEAGNEDFGAAFELCGQSYAVGLMDEYLMASIMGFSFLTLVKQLSTVNYHPYVNNRIDSFVGKFALSAAQREYLVRYLPSKETCNAIHGRIGNKVAFRRAALDIAQSWASSNVEGTSKSLSDILLTLFSNVEITHIVLIQRYVIEDAPSILEQQDARTEANHIYLAMLTLAKMGPKARYVRMMYAASETPELNRSNMRLVAAYAQTLAQRDYPTLANYAKNDNAMFTQAISRMLAMRNALAPVVSRAGLQMISHEYRKDEAVLVQGALQSSVSHVATPLTELFST